MNWLKTLATNTLRVWASVNKVNNNRFSTLIGHKAIRRPLLLNNGLQKCAEFEAKDEFILLKNNQQSTTHLSQVREYKAKVRLRLRCKSCFFIWRNGRLYVECKEHPRHKQQHKKSLLNGYDNIPNGYDRKATEFN
jgi:ribosomal protein L36